jgi:5-deoxy-glucuronate isomerase
MTAGDGWVGRLREFEGAFLVLSGRVSMRASSGEWSTFGGRRDVFSGGTFALYLSRDTDFRLTAVSDAEVALCLARAEKRCEPRLVGPDDYAVEERGEGNCSRRIRHVLPPEFAADRLLVVEVYTPAGNWSSYPPHKHDTDDGEREAALEEIYYHRQSDPRGFALQRLYTKDGRLELAATVRDGDVMLIPHGYHGPVAQAPGYEGYYLNVLAGGRRSMANTDDPDHHWIRAMWARDRTT